jgi:hypothetical protein
MFTHTFIFYSILTISADLETVLQVVNDIIPNVDDVSNFHDYLRDSGGGHKLMLPCA